MIEPREFLVDLEAIRKADIGKLLVRILQRLNRLDQAIAELRAKVIPVEAEDES